MNGELKEGELTYEERIYHRQRHKALLQFRGHPGISLQEICRNETEIKRIEEILCADYQARYVARFGTFDGIYSNPFVSKRWSTVVGEDDSDV